MPLKATADRTRIQELSVAGSAATCPRQSSAKRYQAVHGPTVRRRRGNRLNNFPGPFLLRVSGTSPTWTVPIARCLIWVMGGSFDRRRQRTLAPDAAVDPNGSRKHADPYRLDWRGHGFSSWISQLHGECRSSFLDLLFRP